jgi:hypothetical protein
LDPPLFIDQKNGIPGIEYIFILKRRPIRKYAEIKGNSGTFSDCFGGFGEAADILLLHNRAKGEEKPPDPPLASMAEKRMNTYKMTGTNGRQSCIIDLEQYIS